MREQVVGQASRLSGGGDERESSHPLEGGAHRTGETPFPLSRFPAFRLFLGLLVGCWMLNVECSPCTAATLALTPSADTTLIEVAPTNSNGAQPFFNSGTTQNGTRNRALLRFNLSVLPANAVIRSAAVEISVVGIPAEPPASAPFALHRMLRHWGEGTNVAVLNIGQGLPAKIGDATWTHAQFNTNAWTLPGCQPIADYFQFESASQIIYETGGSPYIHGPTTELAEDVQGWVQNPAANFGWIYICGEEGTIFTAKRFGSRENPNEVLRPQLILDYLIPPLITRAERSGNNFLLGFQAQAGHSYVIEYCDALGGGAWQPLVNLGYFNTAAPVAYIHPTVPTARCFRLNAY